jgi:hypothetical protein
MSWSHARRVALSLSLFMAASAPPALAAEPALDARMQAILAARPSAPTPLAPMDATPCVGGMAGIYPCSNIDLLAFVPVSQFAATSTNSLWGWTDPEDNTDAWRTPT